MHVARPDTWAMLAVVAIVLVANLPYLLGISDPNPLAPRSLLAVDKPGLLRGANTLDPNDGYISQSLGHLAAIDLLHGHLPWWDPYEGAGAPLLAEDQSAALFPPTLLLALPNGQFYEQIVLELVAGLATFLVLRRIGLGRPASVAAGAAFALNGTFAWLANAPFNPVALLPLLVLGIELAHGATAARRRGGWWLIAVALSLSLYAGFPETAYIDGLFAAAWLAWRCFCLGGGHWRRLVAKAMAGAGAGLLLSAPILVPFLVSLAHENVGIHAGLEGGMRLPGLALPQLLMPYVYGPPLAFSDPAGHLNDVWGRVGGFLTVLLLFYGAMAVVSPRRRRLKLWVAVWILLVISRMYGEPPLLGHIMGVFPRMSSVAFYRYAFPSLEFALAVLAGLGIDQLAARATARRTVAAVALGMLAVVGIAALAAHHLVVQLNGGSSHSRWAWAAIAWAAGSVVLAGGFALWRRGPWISILGLLLIADAAVMFGLHELSAPRSVHLDQAPVSYLRRHLGDQRFFTLGPIQPQYGAYWDIASVNDDDVPVPTRWTNYVNARLDPVVNALVFVGNSGGGRPAAAPSPEHELVTHLDGYREAGVGYVVTEPGQSLPQGAKTFQLVQRSPTAWIYRLSGAAPYFATSAPCAIRPRGREAVVVSCPRPATLLRRELAFPGWSATVDGRDTPIRLAQGTYQSITVGPGTHSVSFSYTPPDMSWALVGFILGAGWLATGVIVARRRPGLARS
jgi:hypothetical protein